MEREPQKYRKGVFDMRKRRIIQVGSIREPWRHGKGVPGHMEREP